MIMLLITNKIYAVMTIPKLHENKNVQLYFNGVSYTAENL